MNVQSNLPEIVIIGAQKCGTSSLYKSLQAHSDIVGPLNPENNQPVKEIDYFFDKQKLIRGADWYKSHFPATKGTFLDASPNYLSLPDCYGKMKELLPDAKIIVCLRNPVHRAFSQYNHYTQKLPVSSSWDWMPEKTFIENVETELMNIPENLDTLMDFHGMVLRGVYIKQINQLLKHFDRNSIYFSITDFWPTTYKTELTNIQKFLGKKVESLPMDVIHKRSYTTEPLSSKAKLLLTNFYAPYNQQLFDFLGYEIPEWNQ